MARLLPQISTIRLLSIPGCGIRLTTLEIVYYECKFRLANKSIFHVVTSLHATAYNTDWFGKKCQLNWQMAELTQEQQSKIPSIKHI